MASEFANCHQLSLPLRQVIGALWTADMLDIFGQELLRNRGVINPRALEYYLEPEGIRKRDGDGAKPTGYRCTYENVRLGRIPRDRRILRIRATCPEAVRVLNHPLVYLLNTNNYLGQEEIALTIDSLNHNVQKILHKQFPDGKIASQLPREQTINQLHRLGGVDAFVALILFYRLVRKRTSLGLPGIDNVLVTLEITIYHSFLNLAVFTPFFEARSQLAIYLLDHFFCIEQDDMRRTWSWYETPGDYILRVRNSLKFMVIQNLIGTKFQEHIKVARYYIESGYSVVDINARVANWSDRLAFMPCEPLMRCLKALGYRAGKLGVLILPNLAGQLRTCRLPNAFGNYNHKPSTSVTDPAVERGSDGTADLSAFHKVGSIKSTARRRKRGLLRARITPRNPGNVTTSTTS